jgi:hypothetical protein
MTNPYAAGTTVPVERSRAELDKILAKHGATQRGIVQDDDVGRAAVMFVMAGSQYRLEVPLPLAPKFSTPSKWEQACRERWRAVVLLVKAKLELARLGVSTVQREFMADLVLPNGQTLHTAMQGPIADALKAGMMPKLLLTGGT